MDRETAYKVLAIHPGGYWLVLVQDAAGNIEHAQISELNIEAR